MQTDSGMWRLFIAVPFPAAVREAMLKPQAALRREGWSVKWVDPELAHITVKFLGNVAAERVPAIEAAVQSALAGHQSIDVATGSVGAFPSASRPRVVWLGLEGDLAPLAQLAGDVDQAMADIGFDPEERPFRPHITLGRLRRNAKPPQDFESVATAIDVPQVDVHFDRVELIRSVLGPAGPTYTTLAQWPLGSRVVEVVEHG